MYDEHALNDRDNAAILQCLLLGRASTMIRTKTLKRHNDRTKHKMTYEEVQMAIIDGFMRFKTKLSRDLYVHKISINDGTESVHQFYGRIKLTLSCMTDKTYEEEAQQFRSLAAYKRCRKIREVSTAYMDISDEILHRMKAEATEEDLQRDPYANDRMRRYYYPTTRSRFIECANRGATMTLLHERVKLPDSEIKLTFLRGLQKQYTDEILRRGGEGMDLNEIIAIAED